MRFVSKSYTFPKLDDEILSLATFPHWKLFAQLKYHYYTNTEESAVSKQDPSQETMPSKNSRQIAEKNFNIHCEV
mgnify:CR=1 FL=1